MKLVLAAEDNRILRTPAEPVDLSTPASRREAGRVAQALIRLLGTTTGIGIAAPQAGKGVALCIIDLRPSPNVPLPKVNGKTVALSALRRLALVNPEIVTSSEEKSVAIEGCLSLRGREFEVTRPTAVTVAGQTPEGKQLTIEAQGLYARALQHEIDHLNGILISERGTPATPTTESPEEP
jgi:peptide deformylase